MNKEVLLTVLGVIGTLGGTLLGWLLNAYTYKIGRTENRVLVEFVVLRLVELRLNAKIQQKKFKSHHNIVRC